MANPMKKNLVETKSTFVFEPPQPWPAAPRREKK